MSQFILGKGVNPAAVSLILDMDVSEEAQLVKRTQIYEYSIYGKVLKFPRDQRKKSALVLMKDHTLLSLKMRVLPGIHR